MADEKGALTKSVLGSQKTKKTILAISDFYFYFFPPKIKFIYSAWYWPKSVQFVWLSSAADWMYMSRDELRSKFTYAPIWGRGC